MAKNKFNWLIERLEENPAIETADILSDNLLQVTKKDGYVATVTLMSQSRFNSLTVRKILEENNADFILHTSKEPFVDGSAYDYLDTQQKVIGGYGDFFRAISQDEIWPYVSKDTQFILRGLRQHDRVQKVTRLDNKRYEIQRIGLETVIIIALNDYDLGIESIRQAVDEFREFDAVFKSNPNGRISNSAVELADKREIKVFKWGELLGQLNRRWDWKK